MDRRIFIVEDHSFVREMQARLINLQPGMTVCGTAESIEAALADLAALPDGADLVILDLSLFETSGFDLLATIRERWPNLPCVVHSGKPAIEFEAAALEAGAVGYVEKGDAISLLHIIRTTLDISESL
ncbi:MAG: response regulator transcription factor [Rhodothermales bacterium]